MPVWGCRDYRRNARLVNGPPRVDGDGCLTPAPREPTIDLTLGALRGVALDQPGEGADVPVEDLHRPVHGVHAGRVEPEDVSPARDGVERHPQVVAELVPPGPLHAFEPLDRLPEGLHALDEHPAAGSTPHPRPPLPNTLHPDPPLL